MERQVMERMLAHVAENKADRAVGVRANMLAEKHARDANEEGIGQLLKLTVDGMDQAKFKVPRNMASSKLWESAWRPQLHVVGVIVWGWLEIYFIMDPDMKKDSNMECTVIARSLDILKARLDRQGHHAPEDLLVNADNTTREGKNQHFCTFMAYLTGNGAQTCSQTDYLKVGHTHNEQDQRFSSMASCLSRAPVLEDTAEFRDWILMNFKAARGRELVVEVLPSTMNFQKFFAPLELEIHGLAATAGAKRVCHVWRFVQREGLGGHKGATSWEVQVPKHLQEGCGADGDVILLVKEAMASTRLAQQPVAIMTAEQVKSLDPNCLEVAPRNQFSATELSKYRKTAKIVGDAPWNMRKAKAYLEGLCDANEAQSHGEPLKFEYIFKNVADKPIPRGSFDESNIGYDFAPGAPRVVEVTKASAATTQKRIAPKAKIKPTPKAKKAIGPKGKTKRTWEPPAEESKPAKKGKSVEKAAKKTAASTEGTENEVEKMDDDREGEEGEEGRNLKNIDNVGEEGEEGEEGGNLENIDNDKGESGEEGENDEEIANPEAATTTNNTSNNSNNSNDNNTTMSKSKRKNKNKSKNTDNNNNNHNNNEPTWPPLRRTHKHLDSDKAPQQQRQQQQQQQQRRRQRRRTARRART